jgi:LuxR family transcriptional regulator, glucitol operon activator
MASYQRVALYIFFDAIERDLVSRIRAICSTTNDSVLTPDERQKAATRLQGRQSDLATGDDFDLLHGLDIGDKYAVLLRHKDKLDLSSREYYISKSQSFSKAIPIRNATMHGRPLTTEEYSLGFSLANEFLASPAYWPDLHATYRLYNDDPKTFLSTSVALLEEDVSGEVLNNLPIPDYDDTGFLPRPELEKDLKKKILGRHPVVTVLGDGGNGKTALTVQTLYGLLQSNDHNFDAIVWVSAKSTKLTVGEITRIEGAITDSLGLFEEVAELFEPGDETPLDRVRRLLGNNRILLVIDNLETVLDESIRDFASDVPGESKILFTSRVPLGSDLSVTVEGFSEKEANAYLRRLIDAYDIKAMKTESAERLSIYVNRLGRKPLLIKWLALGVSSGLDPDKITANPEMALQFCMENVFDRLSNETHQVLAAMSVVPTAVSASIIQHITSFTDDSVERALAELLRFALIERVSSSEYERTYQIKPFSRAYLVKVLKTKPADSEAILYKFREIDIAFQTERGHHRNRYDPRSFTVRSRSEALAARKLRSAVILAMKDRFLEADEIIAGLRISNPEYFEVFRLEAFIAYRQGDMPRANSSYETAFELAKAQPQLHYFYGGFLMRSFGNYVGAATQFEAALKVDSTASVVLREAARNKLFSYDFPAAQELIDRAWKNESKTLKDEIVLTDLQAQLYTREADHLLTIGDPRGASNSINKLHDFISEMNPVLSDQTLVEHLFRALPSIEALRRFPSLVEVSLLDSTQKLIEGFGHAFPGPQVFVEGITKSNNVENRKGMLRPEGRTERFGFIRDTEGVDTYVARNSVSPAIWSGMCAGRPVSFAIERYASGKTKAIHIELT